MNEQILKVPVDVWNAEAAKREALEAENKKLNAEIQELRKESEGLKDKQNAWDMHAVSARWRVEEALRLCDDIALIGLERERESVACMARALTGLIEQIQDLCGIKEKAAITGSGEVLA